MAPPLAASSTGSARRTSRARVPRNDKTAIAVEDHIAGITGSPPRRRRDRGDHDYTPRESDKRKDRLAYNRIKIRERRAKIRGDPVKYAEYKARSRERSAVANARRRARKVLDLKDDGELSDLVRDFDYTAHLDDDCALLELWPTLEAYELQLLEDESAATENMLAALTSQDVFHTTAVREQDLEVAFIVEKTHYRRFNLSAAKIRQQLLDKFPPSVRSLAGEMIYHWTVRRDDWQKKNPRPIFPMVVIGEDSPENRWWPANYARFCALMKEWLKSRRLAITADWGYNLIDPLRAQNY